MSGTALARVVVILLLAGWTGASAQDWAQPEAGRQETGLPFFRNFGPKEYGAGSQNFAVAQDSRGVIYVGNGQGVLEFDGLRWRVIPTANGTVVRSLAVDATGRVYVGARGELGYLAPDAAGQTRYVSLMDRVPAAARDFAEVWNIRATREGIYFCTSEKLLRLRGNEVEAWSPETPFAFAFHVRERLFVRQADRGLMEMLDGQLRLVPGGERFAQEKVSAMLPGPAAETGSEVLVVTRTQGLFLLDGSSLRPFPTEADAGLKRDLLSAAVRLADGSLVLGTTQGGVYFVDAAGRALGHLAKADGLLDQNVRDMLVDRQGGLWLAFNRGLARVEAGSHLTRFDDRSGLAGTVYALTRHRGQLYAGTAAGLFRLDAGPRFQAVRGIQDQTWAFTSSEDALLVANREGVYEIEDSGAVVVRKSETDRHTFTVRASRASPGRVFVGMSDGLASIRKANGRWVDEGRIPGVTGEVRTLVELPDGRLWVGTYEAGVRRLSFPEGEPGGPPLVERFDTTHGLPSLNENHVYAIGGQAFFVTHRGVYRFDEARGRFEADPRFRGLFPDGPRWVYAPGDDRQGRVWMQSVDEARRFNEAGTAVPQPDGTYRWDPVPLRPFAGSSTEVVNVDDNGVVWLGGNEGLFRYDPRVARDYGQAFTTLVRQVSHPGGGGVLFAGAGEAAARELAYADNALRFEYAAPSFDGLEATRFQVWLEGYDRDWSPWTAEAYREYTNLREGAYRFRVRARNLYGTMSEEGTYAFRVLPPWYRTAWAYAVYLLVAVGLGWGVVRWRVRRVEAEKRALEGTVAARTGELRAKNDQLETLNAIVKSINERLDFDELLEAVLRECRVIHGVEKAAALVRRPGTALFTFRAALGWTRAELSGIELDLAETEARYTVDAEEVSEDVFLIRGGAGRAAEAKLRLHMIPRALMVMRIRIEGQVEGYLVFENQQDEEAFDAHDLELLKGLKEHFVSAFQKARARAATQEARVRAEDREREAGVQRAEAEAQRRVAVAERARAEDANHAKSAFLASMSHELRTPLNGVLGFAQLMDRVPQRSPQDRQHLATIRRSGEHLLDLINDVLSLSKIEAGQVTLSEAPLDLSALVADVCEMVRVRAESKDLWLRSDLGEMPRAVRGDEVKLRQILLNLLGNAVKFTEHGGVTLDARWSDGRAVIEVEDTGPGIAPDELGQLFAPFVQTAAGRRSKVGTGLGLALSRPLARLLDGDITVQSEVGRGTTFRVEVSLPAVGADASPAEPRGPRRVRALAPGQPPRRVLVVDDIADNRALLCGLLSAVGFDVAEAGSGEEALERNRDWQPHLVWMDKRMPGMDGLEATRRIREEERATGRPRVPIVALSASAFDHEREEVLQSGCDDFVPKPLLEDLIFAKAAEHLGVTYIYDEEPEQAPAAAKATVTAERLARLPEVWLAEMRDALAGGDTRRARAVTDQLDASDAALAIDVRAMLAEYRLEELEALVDEAAST